MGAFEFGTKIKVAVANTLETITTDTAMPGQDYNYPITIENVILWDAIRYDALAEDEIPAILMQTAESIETRTNKEITTKIDGNLIIKFRREQMNRNINDVIDKHSKLQRSIKTALYNDVTFGFCEVDDFSITSYEDPVHQEGEIFVMAVGFELSYTTTYDNF